MEFVKIPLEYLKFFIRTKDKNLRISYQELIIFCFLEHKSIFNESNLLSYTYVYIAKALCIDKSNVIKAIKTLKEKKYIHVFKIGNKLQIHVNQLERILRDNAEYQDFAKANKIIEELHKKWNKNN